MRIEFIASLVFAALVLSAAVGCKGTKRLVGTKWLCGPIESQMQIEFTDNEVFFYRSGQRVKKSQVSYIEDGRFSATDTNGNTEVYSFTLESEKLMLAALGNETARECKAVESVRPPEELLKETCTSACRIFFEAAERALQGQDLSTVEAELAQLPEGLNKLSPVAAEVDCVATCGYQFIKCMDDIQSNPTVRQLMKCRPQILLTTRQASALVAVWRAPGPWSPHNLLTTRQASALVAADEERELAAQDRKCRESPGCRTSGECSANRCPMKHLRRIRPCVPASDEDCRQSQHCREWGWCRAGREDDCVRACSERGAY